jgi:hypothetical protein
LGEGDLDPSPGYPSADRVDFQPGGAEDRLLVGPAPPQQRLHTGEQFGQGERRVEARHEGTAFAVGAQPRVHAKHVAVGRDGGERCVEAAPEPREVLVVADRAGSRGIAFLGVDVDDIHVGGHVELGPPELAHPDHVKLLLAPARRADRPPVASGEPPVESPERVADRRFGERGRGLEHFRERGQSREIARDEAQHDTGAQAPQYARKALLVVAGIGRQRRAHLVGAEGLAHPGGRGGLGPALEEPVNVAAQARGA